MPAKLVARPLSDAGVAVEVREGRYSFSLAGRDYNEETGTYLPMILRHFGEFFPWVYVVKDVWISGPDF